MLFHHKRNYVYITLHCDEMKWTFVSWVVRKKTVHSVKANCFCFDEIDACTDVPFI